MTNNLSAKTKGNNIRWFTKKLNVINLQLTPELDISLNPWECADLLIYIRLKKAFLLPNDEP